MAGYKVIQNIEAEDKLFGPLTLKQFIFAIIALTMCFVAFRLGTVNPFFAIPFLPFIFVMGVLAAPFGRDQPTEVWILAKLRFYFKPRKRIWNQTGIQQLVKITVPKKVEENLTNNLSQTEVKSRLNALAKTIDSRGWVIKNVDINLYTQPSYGVADNATASSDRLISADSLPQEVPNTDVTANDDIFENPLAARLDAQIEQSKQEHQREAVSHMQNVIHNTSPDVQPAPPPEHWFMRQQPASSAHPSTATTKTSSPNKSSSLSTNLEVTDAQAEAVLTKAQKTHPHEDFSNHRRVDPIDLTSAQPQSQSPAVTAAPATDILNLAITNDRRVDSLAREASKNHPTQAVLSDEEVVIPLR